jgi:S1-C subfamily serine protease
MIQAVFSATVYVNKVNMNERMFRRLVDSIKGLDTTGTILSPSQKLDYVVRALYKSPLRYFNPGEEYFRQVHRVQATGTGFLVTGDGYLVTNSHIIDRDSAYIRNKFILSTFQEVTENNINSLQSSWAMTLSEEQRRLLSNAYGVIYSQLSSMIIFDLEKDIYVLFRADNEKGQTVTVKKEGEVVIKGKPMPGKDIAVLKIKGAENLPTLSVSKDSIIKIGTEVLVIGYPEAATTNIYLAAESGIEPTLTTGIVSAIKKSLGGWPVIQMDALISHGSSGSPLCNDRGEVIGIATFGSLEHGGTSLASGFNFAIPVSVVKEYLDSAEIKPGISKATRYFNEGLELFYQQFYRKALEKFEQVQKLNENYNQLHFYMDQCNQKIDRGGDRQSPPRKYVFWIMLVIAAVSAGYLVYRLQYKRNF